MERPGVSSLVRTVWCAEVEYAASYPVGGSEYWGISFTRSPEGVLGATIDGPSLRASVVESRLGDRYWGVELASHVVVADAPKSAVRGRSLPLPVEAERVRIGGGSWPVPGVEDLESWVAELVAHGALIDDPEIRAALDGDRTGATDRTWQRRFRRVVGLTSSQVGQLRRAQHAYVLLQSGASPADAAAQAGFADQAHLTRALRSIRDQTPAAIIAAHAAR